MQMKFVELIKPGTKIDFIKWRKVAVTASLVVNAIVLALAIGSTWAPNWPTWLPGLSYGVDFAGGTEMEVKFDKAVDVSDVRSEIEHAGFASPTVQVYGPADEHTFLVRVERVAVLSKARGEDLNAKLKTKYGDNLVSFGFNEETGDKLDIVLKAKVPDADLRGAIEAEGIKVKPGAEGIGEPRLGAGGGAEYTVLAQGPGDKIGAALKTKFGESSVDVRRTEYVGPAVGKQLRNDGIRAIVYAIGMILIYVGFRFDFRFAPGVVIALIHDAIITLGYFVFTRREFNLTSITVILTVVGYSVNDTIVVYDRIRENGHRFKGKPLTELINLSINEMLGRTILTSGATALSLVGLLIYGVGTIFDFAAAMTVGIISGTYSTWYIAAPTTIWLEEITHGEYATKPTKPSKPEAPKRVTDSPAPAARS